jgi:RND family efflux transporter MFP subunit
MRGEVGARSVPGEGRSDQKNPPNIIVAPALLLLLLTAATPAHAQTPGQAPPITDAAPSTCIIKPHITVQLGSPVSGVLSQTLVDRGDTVKQGQVVAQLESSVEQATLALDRIRASNDSAIKVEEADKDLSVREEERKKFLVDQKIANLNSLDELQTKVREGEIRVQQAKMDQKLAELTAERSERTLALKQIRSPIDGVVIERKLSAGEYIYEQTSIITIAQVDPLNVELVLPLNRYGSIKVGSTAIVHPVAPIGGGYEAKAEVVDPVIDAASDTFGVRLILPNPNRAIPAGIHCTVEWPDEKRLVQ